MKKFLPLLFLLFSCEKASPSITNGMLYFKVTYQKNDIFSAGYFPDFKSTIVIFPDMEIIPYGLNVDDNGNIMYLSKVIKSDKIVTINNIGDGFIDLPFGKYSAVCISNNFKSLYKKKFKSCIFEFNQKNTTIDFTFEL